MTEERTPGDDAAAALPAAPVPAADSPVLLYDGVCGFCDGTVRFILARDAGGPMRFAPLQGEFAAVLLRNEPRLRSMDSLLLVSTDNHGVRRIAVRSDAALGIAGYLGGPWALAARIARLVPRPLRNAAYDLFARFRYRLFGRFDACILPAPDVRDRFID